MPPLLTIADPPVWMGLLAACAAAALALVAADPRRRARAMLAAIALTPFLLIPQALDSVALDEVSWTLPVALTLAGAGAIAALSVLFVRVPVALPIAAVATLAFRVPVELGDTTANLLVPLYLVIAAGVLAAIWRTRARESVEDERGWLEAMTRPTPAGLLRGVLAAVLVLYALQASYSSDLDGAVKDAAFFLVPFAVLFRLLADIEWTGRLLTVCFGILVVQALAFSAVGFWEYQTRQLLWNPRVIDSNAFEDYFRVNSVFWDPNMYGRFLALVMLLCATVMLWARSVPIALGSAAALMILWGGLLLTFSQTSIAALLGGLIAVAALRWSAHWATAAAVAAIAAGLVLVLGFGDAIRSDLGSRRSLDDLTSGRAQLVRGGTELALERPVLGHGSGAFSLAYREETGVGRAQATSASHTEPVTVAAEQGVAGLALYLALLVAAGRALLSGAGRVMPGIGRRDGTPARDSAPVHAVARAAVAVSFAALLLHTLGYAAFLSDPVTWVLLAVGVALCRRAPAGAAATDARPAPLGSTAPVPRPAGTGP